MNPESREWFEAAQRSVIAARLAEPMSRELRQDINEEEEIIADLIREEAR